MRSQRQNDGRAFELFALHAHLQEFGGQAWRMAHAPVEDLVAAGFVHSYNQDRLARIARLRALQGKTSDLVSDYGMDFLAKADGTGTYHACQAKNYTQRRVRAEDLGTFFCLLMGPMRNIGYLYTTSRLEVNLRDNIMTMQDRLVHRKLAFSAKRDPIPEIPETELVLRPCQAEALAAVVRGLTQADAPSYRVAMSMPSGVGKTVVIAHVLRELAPRRVICIAPLRISVSNLAERVPRFLAGHRALLVDSDATGTTDLDEVQRAWDREGPLVIFSTFDSAVQVLSQVRGVEEAILVIDEAHNALGQEELVALYQRFERSLVVSATLPDELYEALEGLREVYTFPVARAIAEGYICDYEIVLPHVTYQKTEAAAMAAQIATIDPGRAENVPADLPAEPRAQALFLFAGMMRFGKRRCIAYLPSRTHCDGLMEALVVVGREHHGLRVWTDKIDAYVSTRDREERLHAFQADSEEHDIWILTSVRILDEAVDIPRCDSEFIAHVGDSTSDLRTYQRLMRGARLDPGNPSKKNHLFLYAHDLHRILHALEMLRYTDPDFHKKVRHVYADYDQNGIADQETLLEQENEALRREITVRCMTLEERWEARRQEWITMYQRLGNRYPSKGSKDEAERRVAEWQGNMRLNVDTMPRHRWSILNETPHWSWGVLPKRPKRAEDPFTEKYQLWVSVYQKLGKLPRKKSKDEEERVAANWSSYMHNCFYYGRLKKEHLDILHNTPGWVWIPRNKDKFVTNLNRWKAFYERTGRSPVSKSEDPEEAFLAQWQVLVRFRKENLPEQQREALENTQGWLWITRNPFETSYKSWKEFYNQTGRDPSTGSKDTAEKALGSWMIGIRQKYKQEQLPAEQQQILDQTPGWTWGKTREPFDVNYKKWCDFYQKNKRNPSHTIRDPAEKALAVWVTCLRSRKEQIPPERRQLLDQTPGWDWGKVQPPRKPKPDQITTVTGEASSSSQI